MDLISLWAIDFRVGSYLLVNGVLHLFVQALAGVTSLTLKPSFVADGGFCVSLSHPKPEASSVPCSVDSHVFRKGDALVPCRRPPPPQHLLRNSAPLSLCPPYPPRKRKQGKWALESSKLETQLWLQGTFPARLCAFFCKIGHVFCVLSWRKNTRTWHTFLEHCITSLRNVTFLLPGLASHPCIPSSLSALSQMIPLFLPRFHLWPKIWTSSQPRHTPWIQG